MKNELTLVAREKLLTERSTLINNIRSLSAQPLSSKSEATARFRAEDLNALAKRVTAIDRKLGRI